MIHRRLLVKIYLVKKSAHSPPNGMAAARAGHSNRLEGGWAQDLIGKTGVWFVMEISLALGGGGVKGYAHIGVMYYLEQCGAVISSIAGTSAGGLFGAMYASGFHYEELQEMVNRLDQSKLFNRLPGDGPSLLGLGGVVDLLEELLGDRTFSDLRIPMVMTAVDLDTGQRVKLSEGRLVDAILATIALPGVFPPKEWNGRVLVDGGIVDPVPVSLARAMKPGLPVVASVLTPKVRPWNGRSEPPDILSSIPLINRIYQFRLPQSLSIFMRSVDIATNYLSELRLEVDHPDLIIRPELGDVGLVDQVDIQDVLKRGENAAEAAFPQLVELVAQRSTWGYRISDRLISFGNRFYKKNHFDA
jgi:NTE family protein